MAAAPGTHDSTRHFREAVCSTSSTLKHCKILVAAGVRMTYQQLLSAANSMVAGLEVWVQAQRQQRVKSDIPAVAATICCGKKWVSSYRQRRPRA
jgi:hypothetical protein